MMGHEPAGMFGVLVMMAFGALLYFLPSIIGRHKRNNGAIFVLNLLAGWTFVGWIIALVWALTKDAAPAASVAAPAAAPEAQPVRICPSCGARASSADGRYCARCGRPLAANP